MGLELYVRYSTAREWVLTRFRRNERGAVAIEYVLVVLAVALFLVLAATGLRPVLNTAVNKVGNWVNAVNAPTVP